MKTLIQIEFDNNKQQEKFSKWFKSKGFELFINDNINSHGEPITCLSTDEKMDWGHYFELQ